jgi:hypothetical protein
MEIKAGRIEIVAGVSSVDANGVQLNDGTVLWPDAVIAATGFSTGLAGPAAATDRQAQLDCISSATRKV